MPPQPQAPSQNVSTNSEPAHKVDALPKQVQGSATPTSTHEEKRTEPTIPPLTGPQKKSVEPSSRTLSYRNFWLVALGVTLTIIAMTGIVIWLYLTIFGSPLS